MRRTRSLRKMKLPLRRPSTRSSPSGYAAVISWPNSRTRRAIVSSSKTIRLSSRPPVCLRLAVLCNIHSHRPSSRLREIGSTPANARYPENGFATRDHRITGAIAARHLRFHQHATHLPPPHATQRHHTVTGPQRSHLPVTPGNPCRPVASGKPLRGCVRRPLHVELTELRPSLLLFLPNLHNLQILLNLPRASAAHAHAVEGHLRAPPAAERQPTPRRAAREVNQPQGTAHAEHQSRPARRGAHERDGQPVIIAGEACPSNVETMRIEAKLKTGKVFQRVVPGAPLQRRRTPRAQHVLAHARTQPLFNQGQQRGAHPAPEMAGVAVRGIVVHGQA